MRPFTDAIETSGSGLFFRYLRIMTSWCTARLMAV